MNNYNPLVDDLVKTFSYNCVFAPNNEKTKIEVNDAKDIYDILNRHLFASKLHIPKLCVATEFIGTNHLAGFNYRFIALKDSSTFTLVTKPTRVPNGKILMPPMIKLNPMIVDGVTLMLFVNALAHEMIHQDDIINGSLLQRKYDARLKGVKNFNPHEGYFNAFADAVNSKFGLDIKEEGANMDIESNLSIEAIRKSLLEEEKLKAKCIVDEDESMSMSNSERLRLLKSNIEENGCAHCRYLGNGAFEETLF